MAAIRILFVDDEPGIRASLPAILMMHGYDVTSVASVAEALAEINSRSFDVLISDLNIGNPGDGFTVVSAMRRTQPKCITLILTGYPAFETALQAIRSQVDDYLIKPAGPDNLVRAIEERLTRRQPHRPIPLKRVGEIIRENVDFIVERTVERMRDSRDLGSKHAQEEEHKRHLRSLLLNLTVEMDRSSDPLHNGRSAFGTDYGIAHFRSEYSIGMMVEETRAVCDSISECVQSNLLAVDLSHVVPDLRHACDTMMLILRDAIRAFTDAEHAA